MLIVTPFECKQAMEEKTPLFTELTPEESATVSGGVSRFMFDLDTYMYILGAGLLFGNPGLTEEEIQLAWEKSFIVNRRSLSRKRNRRRFR